MSDGTSQVPVTEVGGGVYRGEALTAGPGQWYLEIDIARNGERLFRSRNRVLTD